MVAGYFFRYKALVTGDWQPVTHSQQPTTKRPISFASKLRWLTFAAT